MKGWASFCTNSIHQICVKIVLAKCVVSKLWSIFYLAKSNAWHFLKYFFPPTGWEAGPLKGSPPAFNTAVHSYKSGKIHSLPRNTTQWRKLGLQSKPVTPLCLSLFIALNWLLAVSRMWFVKLVKPDLNKEVVVRKNQNFSVNLMSRMFVDLCQSLSEQHLTTIPLHHWKFLFSWKF